MAFNKGTLRHTTWLVFGLTLLFVVVWQAPAIYTVHGLASYLPLHISAETFSIVVSMMVFGIVWNDYSKDRPGNIVMLGCALLAVGLIDFAHMLSYKGMPDFVTPGGPEKAINFWLSARLIAALALLALVLRPWRPLLDPRNRYWMLAGSLAVALGIIWLGLVYPQAWPRTFIAGQGLTTFKLVAEYTIIAILLVPAIGFYFQARRRQSYDAASLYGATAITILSELSFTLYSDVADMINLLGHLYKIVAYTFIYRAVFVVSVRDPFQRLDAELAKNGRITKALMATSLYARSLIEASPDPLVIISGEGKITDLNEATEKVTGMSRSGLIGTDFTDYFTEPAKAREVYRQVFRKGAVSDYPLVLRHCDGHLIDVLYNASAYRDEKGQVLGVFAAARDITELKRAEAARTRFSAIVESSSDAILGKTLDGIVTSWNKGAEGMYGYPADEIVGQPITVLAHPSLHEEIYALINKVRQGEVVTNYETERIRKDGTRLIVSLTLSPIHDATGNIVGVSTIARDITQLKRDEEARQRLNRELRAISNCTVAMMRAEDEQALLGNICRIVCDDAGYRMAWVGYPENDESKSIRPVAWAGVEDGYLERSRITWADTEHGRGPSGTAIRNGKSVSIQDFTTDPKAAPWREAALQRGYRSSIALPLKDESAHTFGILNIYSTEPNAFTQDEVRLLEELAEDMAFGITVLRTRSERQRGEAALRNSQQRMDNIVANSPGAIYRCANDKHWTMEFISAGITQITGYPTEDFLDNRVRSYASIIHPDDRRIVDEAVSTGLERKARYQMDYRLVATDGTPRWVHEQGQGVFAPDGRLLCLDGVIFDITDQRSAEEEIRRLNQELEQRVSERTSQLEAANKELEAFAYSVSHDLRAPLRAIDGFSHILQEDYADKLDDEGKRLFSVVRDNTVRMGQLIDDILKFSRSGRLEINFSSIDMEKLARAVFAELQPADAESKLQLEIEPMPPARGDSAMLRQVFVNLLSNAIKFSRTRETPQIKVGASVEGNETVYYVKDNGVGFDMRYADKLFGVFQRLHAVEEFEGTGIGLAIVKRIMSRHGGRVWAQSKINEGATIYFSMPTSGSPPEERA